MNRKLRMGMVGGGKDAFIGAIHRNRFIGSANLKYTFNNGFFIGAQAAYDYVNDRNTNVEAIGTGYLDDQGINGDMSEQNVKQTELNIDVTAGKNFKFSDNFSLNVYPNPTIGKFNINLPFKNSIKSFISITDLLGRKIKRIESISNVRTYVIDLNGFENGIYIVSIENDGVLYTSKIIKNE